MQLRKIPVAIKDKVAAELLNLEKNKIIERATGTTQWSLALLIVNKPTGGLRLVIDPRPLNKALLRDHYPMTTIDDILPKLSSAKIFSTVDATNAFGI